MCRAIVFARHNKFINLLKQNIRKNLVNEIFLPSFQGFYESIWTPDWEIISIDHEERGITLTDDWGIDEQYYTDLAREYVSYL